MIKQSNFHFVCNKLELRTNIERNEQRNVSIDKVNQKIKLSQIFEWYKDDFELFYDNRNEQNNNIEFNGNKMLYFIWNYAHEQLRKELKMALQKSLGLRNVQWS